MPPARPAARAAPLFPAGNPGPLPRGAARRAGRMRSASPHRPAPHRRKGERRAAGRWTAPAGWSWVRGAVRPGGGSGEGKREDGASRGGERGGERVEERPSSSHPPPLDAEWFGPRGMRCSAQRIEAGGMNHPTWRRGGPCPAAPPRRVAAVRPPSAQRAAVGEAGDGRPEPARRHLGPGGAEGSGARRRGCAAPLFAAASLERETQPGSLGSGVAGGAQAAAPLRGNPPLRAAAAVPGRRRSHLAGSWFP